VVFYCLPKVVRAIKIMVLNLRRLILIPQFPKLPRGLTLKELKAEIKRRMDILHATGDIKPPRNNPYVLQRKN
jgi:hypothetical protein